MAEEKKKPEAQPVRKSGFASGLAVYIWIMLILIGVFLCFLYKYLGDYERSLPDYCVEDYKASLQEAVPAAAVRALDQPAALAQSEELKSAFLAALFQDAVLQKDAVNSRDYHYSYLVKASDGQILGSAVFEPVGKASFGLTDWKLVEERYDFSGYYQTIEVTVPSDYTVYVDDQLLDRSCIRESGIAYEALSLCEEDYPLLPTMVRYETPPFLVDAAVRVLNEKGEEVSAEQMTEEFFLDRCPEETREQIEGFLPEFMSLYIQFSADINDSAPYYYNQLSPMVVPGSVLSVRMKQADEGFGYSGTRHVELISVETDQVMSMGGGRYAVDLRYTEEITGSDREVGPVQKERHILLVLVLADGQPQAEALYYL